MANEANPALGTPKLFPGLQGAPAPAPSLPKTAVAQPSEESKNVFTELFGNDVSQKNGTMMNTVVAQNDKKGISYFGEKPKTPELSLKQFTKHRSNPGASVLKVAVFVLFVTAFGFGTQTNTHLSLFGVNPALRLETVQGQVDELQAEVFVQKNLAAALLLDQYSSTADEYLYARAQVESEYTSTNKREEYVAKADTLKSSAVDLLSKIQSQLKDTLTSEQVALSVQTADELITQLQNNTGSVDEQDLLQEARDLQTAKSLLQNAEFRGLVSQLDLSALSDDQIQQVFDEFSSINASLSATIHSIQSARIAWSVYLDEIEYLTKKVDPLFNTEFQSNLALTDVMFSENGEISLSGETITDDTKNFTLISNLIDLYEASPYFENVEERSYTKSSSTSGYSGSFRITMTLEANPDSNE